MTFISILFGNFKPSLKTDEPAFFVDLNLDQVLHKITKDRQAYDLNRFFYTSLQDVDLVEYRQEVFRDIEEQSLFDCINSFAQKMILVRRYMALSEQIEFQNFKEGWFLETAVVYCEAVTGLAADLKLADLRSRGFVNFRKYLADYISSNEFETLLTQAKELKSALSTIQYCVNIDKLNVTVRRYEGENDYSAEVMDTFEKFKQGVEKDYRAKLYQGTFINHVEAKILACVAKLYPDVFGRLHKFCEQHSHFLDETICVFDREIQFYIAYLDYIARLKKEGLNFCYPHVSKSDKEVCNYGGFDLALADKTVENKDTMVCNDFFLKDPERIIVVSGPNQGGKTTFARTFGQLHYLAGLGCPVPGQESRLFLPDAIFTHFENEENLKKLRGKLQDDLIRISQILDQATPNSIIILNEMFTSTTLKDAIFLGKKIMQNIDRLDLLSVYVTFMDELAAFNEKTISMVSTVVPENPAMRTFKIVRRPADGFAYAMSIVEEYRLTYTSIRERIHS